MTRKYVIVSVSKTGKHKYYALGNWVSELKNCSHFDTQGAAKVRAYKLKDVNANLNLKIASVKVWIEKRAEIIKLLK